MPGPAETLATTLREALNTDAIQVEPSFNQALIRIQPPRSFEAIILDLYLGDPHDESNKEGLRVWEEIWKNRLMPIAIHTAGDCDLDPPVPEGNPFVKCFTKGADSDLQVAEYLESLMPHILELRRVEAEFNTVIHGVLVHTAPLIWQATQADEQLRPQLLLRTARRQLAATLDTNTTSPDERLLSWEQYIYPSVGQSLLMGDVLCKSTGVEGDPTRYRVVLTPSCDLQMNNGKCKVTSVLVARCRNVVEYRREVGSTDTPKSKKKLLENLPAYLSQPHHAGFIPLPAYASILPGMTANLRDLELIPIDNIALSDETGRDFSRIASVDSPFREHLSWAYLQIAGRPGIPDRDLQAWAQEIVEADANE